MNQSATAGGKRPFFWLNATQFLGALNDNLFKLILIYALIDSQGLEQAGSISAMAGAIFVVPFLLFSPLAGRLADRVAKPRVIVATKVLEIVVMAIGALALWNVSSAGLYLTLFLMALQSTFFSPAKYGIIPELVPEAGLSRANGLLEALTYLAIILGTASASLLPLLSGEYRVAGCACLAIAVIGLVTSLRIVSRVKPPQTVDNGSGAGLGQAVRLIARDRYLALAVSGAALFMLVGAFVQLNLIPLGIQTFGLNQEQSGALFLLAAFGIGSGSLLAGCLSGRNVELGVVPIGAALLCAGATGLGLAGSLAAAAVAIVLLGVGGGLFIVPLHAFVQARAPESHRGKVLAAMNQLGWSCVLLAAALTHLVNEVLALPAAAGFLGFGLFLVALTLLALAILPDFLLRFVALVLMKLVYRVRVSGREHVPTEGGALLVANHVSWLDSLLLLATQQRRIRFLMEREVYHSARYRFLFRIMGVIPISSRDGRRELLTSFKQARQALDDGYLVCIFAEGALTRNGTLMEFRPGFERIVKGTEYPVIPVHIGGIWGSIFSYKHGPLFSSLPKALPERVTIGFGRPLPADSRCHEVRDAVLALSTDASAMRKSKGQTLAYRFVASARSNWSRPALADTGGQRLNYGRSLVAALLLKRTLRDQLGEEKCVGILLPPSVGGALANLAVILDGRVPINLNYSAGESGLRSAIEQAGIGTIFTSRRFEQKAGMIGLPGKRLFLEDMMESFTAGEKIRTTIRARLVPASRLLRGVSADPDGVATIIFSSGSTAEPKGVMLSHFNVVSNVDALNTVFSVGRSHKMCGVLPLFHSFGFTGTLWFPLLSGFSAVYHPNPLDARGVVTTVRDEKATFLLATPTFLGSYLRRANAADFESLQVVVTGAEKLSSRLAEKFQEKFGLAPLEGYGATELSPVAAINLPDVEVGRVRQIGTVPGSVGRPLPGIAVRIVDPESGALLGADQSGMIQVRGSNVMLGYLNNAEKTAGVLKDGWYETGDIGSLDRHGFLRISGRLARFSKIAGEMVSHGALEELLQRELGGDEPEVAVTAVPDERKGERIVICYRSGCAGVERLRRVIDNSDLPNLWRPTADSYIPLERLPLLGSGKLDLQALKKLAEELLGHSAAQRQPIDLCGGEGC